ncbi:MAG: ABC transporter substrate-binding protein [Candidatus Acidiferrales bacterium]
MLRRLAASSVGLAVLLVALSATTARRPRYGGTLRVEIAAKVASLDPAAAAGNEEEDTAKWKIDSLVYDTRDADGTFRGAGPFHVTAFEAGKRAVLAATEDYPLGRPFVDSIEITMGRAARERILDLELNKTDFAEIPAEDARRAAERGVRVSRSRPDELLALVFLRGAEPKRARPIDERIREAIALSIDREAIVNFILQKEGEPAGGLLPQWSSGTAFLFSTVADVVHAKELSAQILPVPKIVLGYDSGDSLEQAVAERIAVDAREARVQLAAQAVRPGLENATDARLVRLRMRSKSPGLALESFIDTLGSMTKIEEKALPDPASAEDIYNRERAIVSGYRVVPLVWLPRVYGLSGRVRDWTPPGPGESWPLADVWLDGAVEAAVEEGKK